MKTKNFFFIDSRVKNYQAFVSGLRPTDAWVLLNADQDGLDQMVSALAGLQDLDSIQIVSHGDQASLTLGSTILNSETVQIYQFQLGAIGASLAAQGDILLYGCNLAQGAEGEQLVQTIAQLTQADVAASKDLTGAAAAGGNWTLEYAAGQLETSVFVPARYSNTLALSTLHEGNPLTGAISGGAGDDEYRGGLAGTTPFGIDSLQVVDLLGNATVQARMVDPSRPYFAAAVQNSSFVFGDGTVLFDAGTKGGCYTNGIQSSQLTFGEGSSRTTVVIEGPAIYSATGISGSTLKLGGGVDEVDVQVTWNTTSWPLTGISGSTLDLGTGDDRLLVTLINDLVSLSSWAMSGVTVEMGAGNDVLEVRGINGIYGGQVSGGDGDDRVEVTTQQSGLKYATLSMGAGNDRVTLTQTGSDALSVQNATIDLGAGDDTVQLSRGTATILGGAGTDQLVLPGVRSYYNLVFLASEVQLTIKDDVFTSLTLKDIESIKFADLTVNTVIPTIAVSSSKKGLIAGDSATLTFTLSEPSTNFIASDVTVTGGTLSNFTGSGTTYTAIFTPKANSTASGEVSVGSGVFTGAAGNANADGSDANNTVTLAVDSVAPSIALTSTKTSLIAGDTATLTFTLSEASTSFAASDVAATGGTLSNFSGSGTTYTALFTPIADSTMNGVVSVASSVFTDDAGNANADGADANNTFTITVNTVPSGKSYVGTTGNDNLVGGAGNDTISGGDGNDTITGGLGNDVIYGGKGTDTVSYSGAYGNFKLTALYEGKNGSFAGFTVADLSGSEGTDTVNSDVEYLTFSSGSVVYKINNGTVSLVDTTAPTIAITSSTSSLSASQTATITFTLSESSSNFAVGDVTVSGGALSNFSGSGTTYTALFTPTANSTTSGVVRVASSVFSDAAGNANADGSDANNTVTMSVNTVKVGKTYVGTTGNEIISGTSGNDTLDGGAGTDTASWTQSSSNYQLTSTATGWKVIDKTGTDGTDTVTNIEKLRFADRTVIIESQSHASYSDIPTELYQFFITTFNAAPGVTYMDQLAEAYRYGLSVKKIVDIFTTKSQFTEVYSPTLSHTDMATQLVNNIVKSSATTNAKTSAVADIKGALDLGWTLGDVVFTVFGNLAHKSLTDATWGNTVKQFNNEIAVAKYYTETLNQSTTDLETLRDVIQPVTQTTNVSSDAVVAQLIGVALMTGGIGL